jgi:N-acetylneuraminic acid mutarotase
MAQINKAIMKFSSPLSFLAIVSLGFLSSCGSDSTTTTSVKSGLWTSKADFPDFARGNATGFLLGGKFYLVGGYSFNENKRFKDVYEYNPATNTWSPKAQFPGVARTEAVAFTIGTKGYVGTGRDDSQNRLSDFWEYDPAANQWTKVADFVDARTGAIAFTISNRGFVGTGNNGSTKSDLWEYVPAPTNAWVSRATFSKKRENASVMVINNAAYVLGGISNSIVTVTEFEKFTAATTEGVFELKAELKGRDANGNIITQPSPRQFASTFTIGEFGYWVAGSISGNTRKDVWQYDPVKDTWVEYISLPDRAPFRDGALSFGVGNFGYLTTGRQGNFRFDDTWVFDPAGVTK